MRTLAVALAFGAALGAQQADDLERLFHARQWFELQSAVTNGSPSLMRAAVATAFNDPETAERLLRDVIRSAPASNAADEAYRMLFADLLAVRPVPSMADVVPAVGGGHSRFRACSRRKRRPKRNLPGGRIKSTAVRGGPLFRHDSGDFTIPVSVNGKADDFLFDTGAWQSAMTARKAARLGLKIDGTRRVFTGSSGQSAGFRTAIATEVDVGGIQFRNVSFAVIEGSGPIADADIGIVGMPILLALGVIRWSPDGAVEIGSPAPRVRADQENLVFDRNRLLLRMR